jgi:uncharacterized protein
LAREGVAWHFGRTAITKEGPFSDYTGYERLQVVTKGAGLVLVAPDHEIDPRHPMRPQRYDGGMPIRVQLEMGRVEVVNLIADRARFEIDLRVVEANAAIDCKPGQHVAYAPVGVAQIAIDGSNHIVTEDHALRVVTDTGTRVTVRNGQVIIGSIHNRR